MIFSETNTKIAPALAKAWGAIESPEHNSTVKVKTKSGGEYTFDYTDLGGIFDAAKEVFRDNGISILQNAYTTIAEGKKLISVETMLLHSSGEYVKSLPLQMDANSSIQDMGGQVTYMKRYSLTAILGISTEKDDDANGASGNSYQQTRSGSQSSGKVSEKQMGLINRLLSDLKKKHNVDDATALKTMQTRIGVAKPIDQFTTNEASTAIKYLQEAQK